MRDFDYMAPREGDDTQFTVPSTQGFTVAPPAAVAPNAGFSVFGDTGITYGQGDDGQYYFGSDPISATDYQGLTARHDPLVVEPTGAKSGRVVDPYMPNDPSPVVDPFAVVPDAKPKPPTNTAQIVPANIPAASMPTDPNFTVATAANPDFGMYGNSAQRYVPPPLQAAHGPYSTPYYAAYTNDGDVAGAVMVAPGQAIRLVDAKTGEVVFQGQGPEAAQQAVGIANAVSNTQGRRAAWAIQAETPDSQWQTQAYDRYDPKKQSLFGKLADIALPILGTIALGPIGAAIGSGISSVAQGRSLGNTVLRAGLSYGGAAIAPGISNAIGGALAPAAGAVTSGALDAGVNAGTNAAVQAGTNAAAQGAGTLLSEVVVNGVRTLVPAAVASGLGAGVGSLAGGAFTSGGGSPSQPASTTTAQPPASTTATQPTPAPNTVEELVVTGLKRGLTVQQLVEQGLPLATINAVMATMGAGPTVDPLTVTAKPPPTTDTQAVGAGVGAIAPTTVSDLTVTAPTQPPSVDPAVVGAAAGAGAGTLLGALTSGHPQDVVDWVKAHPLEAAGLGLTVGAGLLGAGGSGSDGPYGIPGGGGNGAPGTRGSLSPIFSASLPPPTGGPGGFGTRTPRPATIDSRYAIEHPEASFFSSVPQASGPDRFAVPSPHQALLAGIPDLNNDGVVDDLDLAVFRKRFGGQGYAKGGFAVGRGGGRDDMIDARLSDGEYVIDAETVALLGDGSSKAGARKLDDFRVKVRKDKGRDLAKGRISRDARDPHSYMGAH